MGAKSAEPKEEKKAEPLFKFNASAPVNFGGKQIESTPSEHKETQSNQLFKPPTGKIVFGEQVVRDAEPEPKKEEAVKFTASFAQPPPEADAPKEAQKISLFGGDKPESSSLFGANAPSGSLFGAAPQTETPKTTGLFG